MSESRPQRSRPVPLEQIDLRDRRPYPEGWFRLADATSLPRGAVSVVRASGRDVVLFRTQAGALGALDAFCPHLGAHLGHGGRVCGEALRCPFHGLRFAPDGSCAGHEYPGDPRVRARVAAWPAREWEGQVMVFLSQDGREPDWALPEVEGHGFSHLRWSELELDGHVQDITENGVDVAHFGAVHRYFNVSEPQIRFDCHRIHSKFSFHRKSPVLPALFGNVRSVFDTEIHGLGCSITHLTVEPWRLRAQLFLMPRQMEARRVCFAIGARLAVGGSGGRVDHLLREGGADLVLRFLMVHVVRDTLQDLEIWRHRIPLERPSLIEGDGPIGQFRRHARQFYPARSPSAAPSNSPAPQ